MRRICQKSSLGHVTTIKDFSIEVSISDSMLLPCGKVILSGSRTVSSTRLMFEKYCLIPLSTCSLSISPTTEISMPSAGTMV